MQETPLSQAMSTITEVIDVYDASKPRLGRGHDLLVLTDLVRLLAEHNVSLDGDIEKVGQAVQTIQDGLRGALNAAIGPLIGRLAPAIEQELQHAIDEHRRTIDAGGKDADAASWHIGRLEHQKRRMRTLFQLFVAEGKNL